MGQPGHELPPHDAQAEAGALGCLLWNGEASSELLEQLRLDDFYEAKHQQIYKALNEVQNNGLPVCVVSVDQWLRDHGQSALLNYLAALPDQVPSPQNFPLYLATLEDRRTRRAALADAIRLKDLALNEALSARQLDDAVRRLLESHTANRNGESLTLRTPDEILAMEFDPTDIVLGDHLLTKGATLVIAAQGGAGKSRLGLQLAACVTTGREWLGLPTHDRQGRWLVLQTENSNQRLKADLAHLRDWLGDDWIHFQSRVVLHTLESDTDGLVSLDDPYNVNAIRHAIEDAKPDHLLVDPLVDYAVGDLNKDVDMRITLKSLSRITREANHRRTLTVLHHALSGKGGAVKATGYDRSSFARNSKVLLGWTRSQINLAPVDAASNQRLIVACGKCNDGIEFETFAIRLNPDTMIYETDSSVDVPAWQAEVEGKTVELMNPNRVQELCPPLTARLDLVRAIQNECGCSRATAYRHIKLAVVKNLIGKSEQSGLYSPK